MRADFAHIDTWVFDLDETLYPPSTPLFPQIETRMTDWIMRETGADRVEADRLRTSWWEHHGTTLAGLMADHGIDPHPFLADVHDIDFSVLSPDPALADALAALPGRRIIFTNGTVGYAAEVLAARGLGDLWDAVYGVEEAGLTPKPQPEAYTRVFGADGLDTTRAAMFEDTPRNLAVPHTLGMSTIHVAPVALAAPHLHHHTDDLTHFLRDITRSGA
ncbi:pyrimidine 5'-nucleotidase [Jannaschia aquimarina]|uniref:Haloacid dehalogenase-like hydrolase n=1 Tax=Jannaschia aquimarina TaxID=935700 RepID=A0A0D1ELB6_9RHOB|nr:pyrimidine 5'-nucleotidase [Jannaschia aquimarina]KIT17761.1 haloacid dehalogenase-like hydrolase [Jannaschia aquimarina]SNS96057.1 putative hydrolase of the HAD superfamily [Jannaschia aquimarina]